MATVKKVSDSTISISLPQNSFHEIDEVIIIFGAVIYIIYNSSYKQGFGDREEEIEILAISKKPQLNPAMLCEDVYTGLIGSSTIIETGEDAIVTAKKVIGKYNM